MENMLHIRMSGHSSNIRTRKTEKPVAAHFCQLDHTMKELQIKKIHRSSTQCLDFYSHMLSVCCLHMGWIWTSDITAYFVTVYAITVYTNVAYAMNNGLKFASSIFKHFALSVLYRVSLYVALYAWRRSSRIEMLHRVMERLYAQLGSRLEK